MKISGESFFLVLVGMAVGAIVLVVAPKVIGQPVGRTEFVDLSADPPLGSPLPADFMRKKTDAHGRLLPDGLERVMLVSGGSCSGCSRDAVKFDKLPSREFDAIVVLYSETRGKIRAAYPPPANIHLVEDTADLQRLLNAAWLGRWYVFDKGRLVALQKNASDRSWAVLK